jgi:hypothetical protein
MRILSLILFAVVAVGCSRTSPTQITGGGVLNEARVLAIARAAVATNDTWIDQAEFEKPDHETNGSALWFVAAKL